jgi:hypothetical protein
MFLNTLVYERRIRTTSSGVLGPTAGTRTINLLPALNQTTSLGGRHLLIGYRTDA